MAKAPEGELVPFGGPLSDRQLSVDRLSVYLHVPFCSVRCGYCDFNTYTADELVRDGVIASRDVYIDQALSELRQARAALGEREIAVNTIFVGGGTPTLLPASDLGRFFAAVGDHFALADDAEITVEANPDTLSPAYLQALRSAGANRLSIGMQSVVPQVLSVLERTHRPESIPVAVDAARAAGFSQLSVDLIYGSPAESIRDWRASVEAALALDVDHISAYALIVEEGTRLAQQVQSGALVMPDEDETAEKYLLADELISGRGMQWYEVSNWAKPGAACRHNLAYWQSADWWGIGPGAHSHVGGTRWWNVKHPAAYAARLAEGSSPAHAREVLTREDRLTEELLLRIRLRAGLALSFLDADQRRIVERQISAGLFEPAGDVVVLTRRGRLLADAVVRELLH